MRRPCLTLSTVLVLLLVASPVVVQAQFTTGIALTDSDSKAFYGDSVAIYGSTVAIAAPGESSYEGYVYVYSCTGSTCTH